MRFKGVNLGGWLMMEGYLLGGRNIAERRFKGVFRRKYGTGQLAEFERLFRDNFIREADFARIAALGANCIRVPFNCRLIMKKPHSYDKKGLAYLDKVFLWASRYGLKVILDLHAAPGAQNCDWHGDSAGEALFWKDAAYRDETLDLWEYLAGRYKSTSSLSAYDIINEPVLSKVKVPVLASFYRDVIRRIRKVDSVHTIFLEGHAWAQEIDFLTGIIGEGTAVSVHTYQPLDFTFQFTPEGRYPGKIEGRMWNKSRLRSYLRRYYDFSRRNKTNILVGEFGVNYRRNAAGEVDYLHDILDVFREYSFDYTYWTYKSVYMHVFPNGIYQYRGNPAWVCREGPVFGWENYLALWEKHKKAIVDSWRTENYTLSKEVADVLRRHFKK